jgi:hypothetical protein
MEKMYVLRTCGNISLYNKHLEDPGNNWTFPQYEGNYPELGQLEDWELNAIAEIISLSKCVGIGVPDNVPWTFLISCIRGDYTEYYDMSDEDEYDPTDPDNWAEDAEDYG